MKLMMFVGMLIIAQAASAKDRSGPNGFTCTGADGTTKRFNIDLKRGRYDAGEGVKRLSRVTDTVVTIDGGNPDLMSTPMGPILHSLTLDRATLVLTDQTMIPDRSVNRTTTYRCVMGPAIDFRAGRQF